ncbi:MAG: ribonuclease R [Gammaproteobacteria bacterium]|nr:ribonuclease R [Gammaproteobacteria bacterium]
MIKKFLKKDPYLEREKEKYENPIPSRELIIEYLDEEGCSVSKKHLVKAFGLESEEQIEALRRRLRAMERDGQIISNRRGQYALVKDLELIRGLVIGRKDGYGFLVPDDASSDLYLSSYQMRVVFPNDIVLARISSIDSRGRKEGTIVEVLERNTLRVVGYFREEGGVCFVEPDKKEIQQVVLIPREEAAGAKEGQMVVVEIIAQPTLKRQATGKVTEILGEHMAPGLEIEVAIRSYELPFQWSDAIMDETRLIPETVAAEEANNRNDLRKLPFVTIDGEDAKDFDDAVFCEPTKAGWKLYVAIADVSHYVKVDANLDREAFHRGNSVYFPNRVIPMLPEELSNGICSLKPNVDRLCMVCEMNISKEGILENYQFYEGIICSQARLTYTEVSAMIQGEQTQNIKFLPQVTDLHHVYEKLLQQRLLRGALEFETVETRIIFGENRKIEKIIPIKRNEAHRLIEECMLVANVAAAEFLSEYGLPLLYRVHKVPDPEKLENLRSFLQGAGLRLTGKSHPEPIDYATLIKSIQGRPDAHIIQTILLRSLRQAIYSPVNEGHFGLAYDHYCHFTSPIRRFPDVLVHRALKHALKGKEVTQFVYSPEELFLFADHCSMTERRADDATRGVTDWLKCEYMLEKIGCEFEGVISEVTGFGIFVELKDIYVEGLVHITALKNDYYHFDPVTRRLMGKRTNTTYGLGDLINVKIVRVNLDQKQMDFDLVDNETTSTKTKPSKARKRPKKKKRKEG